jgi:hypothetical protein
MVSGCLSGAEKAERVSETRPFSLVRFFFGEKRNEQKKNIFTFPGLGGYVHIHITLP